VKEYGYGLYGETMGRVSKLELKRKVFHILFGTLLALLFHRGWLTKLRFVALVGLLAVIFFIYLSVKIPFLHEFMQYVEREKHMNYFPGIGAIFFVFGMTVAVWLFPKSVAVSAILILAWSDGISGIVGPYGKIAYINPRKTWEGIMAGSAVGAIAGSFFVPFGYAFAGASVAMLIEGLDIKISNWKIDDNLIIPAISGAVMVLLGIII
jgi:dolichol kinase